MELLPPGSESFEEMLLRLARIPVGPWKPCVLRFEHGTEVYWKQGHCLARWVTNEISVFENASGEIVGCRIENLPPRGRPFEFTQEHLDALRDLPQAPDDDYDLPQAPDDEPAEPEAERDPE